MFYIRNSFTCVVCLILFVLLTDDISAAVCPPCYQNQPNLNPTGGPDAQGRLIILVSVDSRWAGYRAKIINAFNIAAQRWNSVHPTRHFAYSATTGDIFIASSNDLGQTPSGGCSSIITNQYPRPLNLKDSIKENSEDDIADNIAHELGHAINLANADKECAANSTIMRGTKWNPGEENISYSLCLMASKTVSPADAAASDNGINQSTQCKKDYNNSNNQPSGPPTCEENNQCMFETGYTVIYNPDRCGYPETACREGLQLTNDTSTGAECCVPRYTPLIVDLLGNGYNLTNSQNGVLFDIVGSGTKARVAWTQSGSDDGFLALDRNHNNVIDDGTELFGNQTEQLVSKNPNGFLALALFDKYERGGNNDGTIDRNDQVWDSLKVWTDSNHDGISQQSEISSMQIAGLVSITLKYFESSYVDLHGNQFKYRSRAIFAGQPNRSRWIYDIFLIPHKED